MAVTEVSKLRMWLEYDHTKIPPERIPLDSDATAPLFIFQFGDLNWWHIAIPQGDYEVTRCGWMAQVPQRMRLYELRPGMRRCKWCGSFKIFKK